MIFRTLPLIVLLALSSTLLCASDQPETTRAPEALSVEYTQPVLFDPDKHRISVLKPVYRPGIDKITVRNPLYRPGIDRFSVYTLEDDTRASVIRVYNF